MDAATVLFLAIGSLGLLLLALSLAGVELFHLDSLVPMEAVAAGLGVFGFASAGANAAFAGGGMPALLGAGVIGVAASVPAGWLSLRLTRALQQMRTDATPRRSDLPGSVGGVVTPIPAQGYGEVRVTLGGQPVKLNARARRAIPLGAQVFVIEATSETSVFVEPVPGDPSTTPRP